MNAPPRDRAGRRWWGWSAAATLAIFAFFCYWRSHYILGDAAFYALSIAHGRFDERSIHVAYYVLGWLTHRLLRPFGVHLDEALLLLSAAAATACVLLAWRFARALGRGALTAFAVALILMFSGNLLDQGTSAEIYGIELALVLASYVLYLANRPFVSGLVFGVAMLVSPLSALAGGFFVWDLMRRRHWKPFALAVAAGVCVYVPVLAWCWRDYFFGVRGLLRVGPHRDFGPGTVVYNVFALAKNFHWSLLFALPGMIAQWRHARSALGLTALTLLFHLPVFVGMREDGVFMLSAYPLLALLVADGAVAWLPPTRPPGRFLLPLIAVLYVATASVLWLRPPSQAYRQGLLALLGRAGREAVIIAPWHHAVALDFYHLDYGAKGTPVAPRLWEQYVTADTLRHLLSARSDVYLVETYYPNPIVERFMSGAQRERRWREHALLPRMQGLVAGLSADTVQDGARAPLVYRLRAPGGEIAR